MRLELGCGLHKYRYYLLALAYMYHKVLILLCVDFRRRATRNIGRHHTPFKSLQREY